MPSRVIARVPPALLQRPLRVIRPIDAAAIYAHPRPEIARLTRSGALRKVASGYYAIVPPDIAAAQPWVPTLEAVGLGIAAADAGIDSVAAMGLSAAHLHGALPRAIAIAVIATRRHRRATQLVDRDAQIIFPRRDVTALDVQQHTFPDLGTGWVTTVEQTLLDLLARPALGGMPAEARAAARTLLPRADRDVLTDLAARQRRTAAVTRFLTDA